MSCLLLFLLLVVAGWSNSSPLLAQKFNLQSSPFGGLGQNDDPVSFTAKFKLKPDSQLGVIQVTAKIKSPWHVYSVTQVAGGPIRSKIELTDSDQVSIIGNFKPDSPPHVNLNTDFSVPVEEHSGSVTWTAPIEIAKDADPKSLDVEVVYSGLACFSTPDGKQGNCRPVRNVKVAVHFDGYDEKISVSSTAPQTKIEPFRPEDSHVLFSAQIKRTDGKRNVISPGDQVTFELTATPDDKFHVYGYEHNKTGGFHSTIVGFTQWNDWEITEPRRSAEPKHDDELDYDYHEQPVTWSFDVSIPAAAESKNYELAGLIGFQTCSNNQCDPPAGIAFTVEIPVGNGMGPISVKFEDGETGYEGYSSALLAIKTKDNLVSVIKPKATEEIPKSTSVDTPEQIAEMAALYEADQKVNYVTLSDLEQHASSLDPSTTVQRQQTTLWTAIFGAFIGGMLLNLMPCVFPVLGLKVLGFVEQAGSDPKKIRLHGIVFTLGLLVSMWVLAGIILVLREMLGKELNWGAQMGSPYFVVSIIVLLFLLGLNMAGVFEIGTSLTRVGGKSVGKKGYMSSFLSGILTTLIATPCSGPFLGAAMGYTLSQPVNIALFLFTIFALGIGFPYIVLTFFPSLLNNLPRPGAWMHTFKVTMAFALFATVAFFMQTFGAQTGVDGLSWLAMALVVLGLAAFCYGTWSLPHIKRTKRLAFGWIMPILIAALGVWMCYDSTQYRNESQFSHNVGGLDWSEWNPGKVEYMLAQNKKPIWVEYTANWCFVCKTNEKTIFSSSEVLDKIKEIEIEMVVADDTAIREDIHFDLSRVDRKQIPVNLFYPVNYPEEPAILLDGPILPSTVLRVLDIMDSNQQRVKNNDQKPGDRMARAE